MIDVGDVNLDGVGFDEVKEVGRVIKDAQCGPGPERAASKGKANKSQDEGEVGEIETY